MRSSSRRPTGRYKRISAGFAWRRILGQETDKLPERAIDRLRIREVSAYIGIQHYRTGSGRNFTNLGGPITLVDDDCLAVLHGLVMLTSHAMRKIVLRSYIVIVVQIVRFVAAHMFSP